MRLDSVFYLGLRRRGASASAPPFYPEKREERRAREKREEKREEREREDKKQTKKRDDRKAPGAAVVTTE